MLNITDSSTTIKELKKRDHLCLIYGSEEEWRKTITTYFEDGKEHGEKCLYIYNSHEPGEIRQAFNEGTLDIKSFEETGGFIFCGFEDFYHNSEQDLYAMIYFLSRLAETSISEGYTALRIAMEMKSPSGSYDFKDIVEFEARLNRYLFSKYPCLALCLYEQREHDPQVIKDVIATHPLIVKGSHLYCNSHYMLPADILSRERTKNEIEKLLDIIERENKNNESLNFLNNVFNESLLAFCALDADGVISICNQAFCEITGYSSEQLNQLVKFPELILDEYLDVHREALVNINASGKAQRYEVKILRQDDRSIYVEILLHKTKVGKNQDIDCFLFLNDISEYKKSEQALKESKQNFADIINFLPDPTMVIDKQGQVIAWNQAMEKISGIKAANIVGKGDSLHSLSIYGDKRPMLVDLVLQNKRKSDFISLKREGRALIAENLTPRIKDQEMYLWAKATPLYNSHGEIVGAIESIRDITEFKQTEKRLKYLSQRDSLTGLYNRSYFEEEMKKLETDITYLAASVGIIVCDVDGLKEINDTLGHKKGDELLGIAARMISEPFRQDDLVARIGGDEFVVLLPNSPVHAVERACQRIRQAVEKHNESSPELYLSISVGFAVSNRNERNMRDLFIEADDNMYREKLYHVRSPRSALVNTLMKALEARDFITEGHAERMQSMIIKLGQRIGLPDYSLNDLRLFAQFHDIGKLGIPDRILFKPAGLTIDEMRVMQGHCQIGCQIAQSAPALSHIADWVLKHHEWWDGSGYPLGLSRDKIPLECRILSIVDAYDAMTSDRPYRKALPPDQALANLQRAAGTQFDPDMVKEFIRILESFQTEPETNFNTMCYSGN